MKTDEKEVLRKFYLKLSNATIRAKKRLMDDSLLFTLMSANTNSRSKILKEGAIDRALFDTEIVQALEREKYLTGLVDKEDLGKAVLTAKGIWTMESEKKGFDAGRLVDFIDKKDFSFSRSIRRLDDNERMVLLSLIGVRAFSKDTPMDRSDRNLEDGWLDVFKESHQFLITKGLVKEESLGATRESNEHPVEQVMRRADDLPKKTSHIYVYTGKRTYYLDIAEGAELRPERLKAILKLVFGKIMNQDSLDEIKTFLESIAYGNAKYVMKELKFLEPKYDELMKEVLTSIFLD